MCQQLCEEVNNLHRKYVLLILHLLTNLTSSCHNRRILKSENELIGYCDGQAQVIIDLGKVVQESANYVQHIFLSNPIHCSLSMNSTVAIYWTYSVMNTLIIPVISSLVNIFFNLPCLFNSQLHYSYIQYISLDIIHSVQSVVM